MTEAEALRSFAAAVRERLSAHDPRVTLFDRLTPRVHGADGPVVGVLLQGVEPRSAELDEIRDVVMGLARAAFVGLAGFQVVTELATADRAAYMLRGEAIG